MAKLWVDDERPAPGEGWVTVKTSSAAIRAINAPDKYTGDVEFWEEISLDHDLGGDDTGFKVLDHLIAHGQEYGLWPAVLTIHTANPPARQRMLAAANADLPSEVDINVIYW